MPFFRRPLHHVLSCCRALRGTGRRFQRRRRLPVLSGFFGLLMAHTAAVAPPGPDDPLAVWGSRLQVVGPAWCWPAARVPQHVLTFLTYRGHRYLVAHAHYAPDGRLLTQTTYALAGTGDAVRPRLAARWTYRTAFRGDSLVGTAEEMRFPDKQVTAWRLAGVVAPGEPLGGPGRRPERGPGRAAGQCRQFRSLTRAGTAGTDAYTWAWQPAQNGQPALFSYTHVYPLHDTIVGRAELPAGGRRLLAEIVRPSVGTTTFDRQYRGHGPNYVETSRRESAVGPNARRRQDVYRRVSRWRNGRCRAEHWQPLPDNSYAAFTIHYQYVNYPKRRSPAVVPPGTVGGQPGAP